MDNRFGILHLSDIHACVNNQVTLQGLVKHLISDIEKVQTEYNVTIKVVCISGDLINSGDNSDEELEIILQDFLQPLMEFLSIDETHMTLCNLQTQPQCQPAFARLAGASEKRQTGWEQTRDDPLNWWQRC